MANAEPGFEGRASWGNRKSVFEGGVALAKGTSVLVRSVVPTAYESAIAGAILVSSLAGCSLAVGDLTLTPQKGNAGGSSEQVGGKSAGTHGGASSNSGSGGKDASPAGTGAVLHGGAAPLGGSANAGSATQFGGASNGGASNGGASNGGASNGGASNGGASNGGASSGAGTAAGATNGGASNGGATVAGGTNGDNGGRANAGGSAATGIAGNGGLSATGGSIASGCTGSYETVQSTTGLCGGKMASITPPSGMVPYGINVTEVTRGQYEGWLATQPAPFPATDPTCGWNTTYVPDPTCMNLACKTQCDRHPQVCVDWCDALRYCAATGKRLCGRIGGGENPWNETANAETSQWYRACSAGGVNAFPYGTTYAPATCNDYQFWAPDYNTTTIDVGGLTGCKSSVAGYAGVYDLSGNVEEWEDSCEDASSTARCNARGGLFFFADDGLACSSEGAYYSRQVATRYIGFRCCSF